MQRVAQRDAGFTLIELMVAVALFVVIMLVAMGALLSLIDANKKARALESVINNLNVTLDGMVRAMRMGNHYACNVTSLPGTYDTGGADCPGGGTTFSFTPFDGDPSDNGERFVYRYVPAAGGEPGRIERSKFGGSGSYETITAPEVSITGMSFYVVGTTPRNTTQPKVVLVVKGEAGPPDNEKIRTTFYIQATAVQRTLDL